MDVTPGSGLVFHSPVTSHTPLVTPTPLNRYSYLCSGHLWAEPGVIAALALAVHALWLGQGARQPQEVFCRHMEQT